MGIEKFIAGLVLGITLANPKNQMLIKRGLLNGAGALTDALNKKGGELNAPVIQTEEQQQA